LLLADAEPAVSATAATPGWREPDSSARHAGAAGSGAQVASAAAATSWLACLASPAAFFCMKALRVFQTKCKWQKCLFCSTTACIALNDAQSAAAALAYCRFQRRYCSYQQSG